jgi:hypothetical protein
MLELILVAFLWGFISRGLWLASLGISKSKRDRQIDLVFCCLWPIILPLGLIIVAFRRL